MPKPTESTLPQGYSIEKTTDGFAVKFPKELLNYFKPQFRGAIWRSSSLTWLIGSRSKKKFETWALEMADKAIEFEVKNDLKTDEDVDKYIAELQVLKIQILTNKIELALGDDELSDQYADAQNKLTVLGKTVKTLEETLKKRLKTKALLTTKLSDVDELESQRIKLSEEAAKELNENKAIIDRAIDIKATNDAFNVLSKYFGTVGSQNRYKFEAAQAILKEQQEVLNSIGLHSEGLEDMYRMNMNRPDRDPLPNFSTIYNVVEYLGD